MKDEQSLKVSIRDLMEQQGGTLTVDADSSAGQVLADLQKAGDVELVARSGQEIIYRVIPMPHPYCRRDMVIWQRDDGTERRARVTGITRKNIRIFTLDDGMVRNVDPAALRYAYADSKITLPDLLPGSSSEKVLDQAIMRWLEHKTYRLCSSNTRHTYSSLLSSFRAALQMALLDFDSDPQRVAEIARCWANRRYVLQHDDCDEKQASPATFNQRLSLLSSFYKFALQQGMLTGVNPIDLVERRGGADVKMRK